MVLLRISSEIKDSKEIMEILNKTVEEEVFQIFDPSYIVSEKQVKIALEKAKNSFKSNKNKSNSLNNELLLWVSNEKNISNAIKKAGVKNPKDFFIFYTGKNLEDILKSIKAQKKELIFTPCLKTLEINEKVLEKYTLEEIILEKMALSYLER